MRAFFTDIFVLPLPPGHRFPMSKYRLLREAVVRERIIREEDLLIPPAATDQQLMLCHTPEYLTRVKSGTLEQREIRAIGFPWTPLMVERSRRSTGATIAACRTALRDGVSANLAGGTHHAGPDWGQGYCVFNDAAVALRVMQSEGRIQRAAVIDADVHQGNGTAAICADDPSIFTFSIHGAKNFPFKKVASDFDVALPDQTSDAAFLADLRRGVEAVLESQPGLVVYIAGADPWTGDRLGKLAVSADGLAERDTYVLEQCRKAGIPVAVVMGGGYAPEVRDTVAIHATTLRIARAMFDAA